MNRTESCGRRQIGSRTGVQIGLAMWALPLVLRAQCVNFPATLVPLSTIDYVTAADAAGDHLVVGALAGALRSLSGLPLPASTNQTFCGQVQLAPEQVFSNVYVQTAAEQAGNFSAFAGLLVDPANSQVFPGGVIPASRLGAVYAFRVSAAQPPQSVQPWALTNPTIYPLIDAAAVLLPSGRVLIAGDGCGPCPAAAETAIQIYDPSTGIFTLAGGSLFPHPAGAAMLLNDGRVLLVGGIGTQLAEIYDPATAQSTAIGSTIYAHGVVFTATLLNNGGVLIAAGFNGTASIASAELFDPQTGKFTATGNLVQGREDPVATKLADGRVLFTGGAIAGSGPATYLNSAEIYDPASGTFSATGSMNTIRISHYSVALPDGKVLVGGGYAGSFPPVAELYDPSSGTFTLTGVMAYGNRSAAAAVLLQSGQVLITGGYNATVAPVVDYVTSELYNPATGSFAAAGNMGFGRTNAIATVLPDGRVLVAGGAATPTLSAAAEVYTPVDQGLVTSQTGATFQAAPGGAPAAQTVEVLSPTDSIPWTLSVNTFTGGNWLSATPSGGSSAPGSAPHSGFAQSEHGRPRIADFLRSGRADSDRRHSSADFHYGGA